MEKPRAIRWEVAGVGISIAALAVPDLSDAARIALCAVGVFLVLLALGWPQRALAKLTRIFEQHVGVARREQASATACRLLRDAAEELSVLTAREADGTLAAGFLGAMIRGRGQQQAIVAYRRNLRTTVVRAVEAGLSAGARDEGAMRLAESAASGTDLLELKAEILRMVVELTPSSS